MKKKEFCRDYILKLLKEKGGKSTRNELRPLLLEAGYGTEGIRQSYLKLISNKDIIVEGSSKSKNQIIILNERNN